MKKISQYSGLNRDKYFLYSLLCPAVIIVVAITIVPLIYTFVLSFQDYMLIKPDQAKFVGFSNYINIFKDANILRSFLNTFYFSFGSVASTIILGVICALIVNKITKGKTFFRVALFVPMLLSAIVIGVMWKIILHDRLGILNYFVTAIGFERVPWLHSTSLAMPTVIGVDVWHWTSYVFILALAALEAVPQEPIESARIDGANAFQIFRYITLPSIMPTIKVAFIFRTIWSFKNFDIIFALTQGGPGISTETLSISIWRNAFQSYRVGFASSISVILFIMLMAISLGTLYSSNKKEVD